MIIKVTQGYVYQTFDDEGKFVSQYFAPSYEVEYDDENGQPMDVPPVEPNHPFDMVQEEG